MPADRTPCPLCGAHVRRGNIRGHAWSVRCRATVLGRGRKRRGGVVELTLTAAQRALIDAAEILDEAIAAAVKRGGDA